MAQKRLTENHPTAIKVRKIEELMDSLSISLEYLHNRFIIQDNENNVEVEIKTIEGDYTTMFPAIEETKLVKDE